MNKERVLQVFRAGYHAGANILRTRTPYVAMTDEDKSHWLAGFDRGRTDVEHAMQRYECQLLARNPFAFVEDANG